MWLTAISSHRNASLSVLGIPHILVAINKMDLVDFSKDVYDKIVADYKKMSEALDISSQTTVVMRAE